MIEFDTFDNFDNFSHRELTLPADRAAAKYAFEELIDGKPSSILDIACGDGFAERNLIPDDVKQGLESFWGIDKNIKALRDYDGDADVAVANATNLPFGDEEFDVVFSSSGMDTLGRQDQRKALSEVARVLKPGGSFIGMRTTARRFGTIASEHTAELNANGHNVLAMPAPGSAESFDNVAVFHREALGDPQLLKKFGVWIPLLLDSRLIFQALDDPYLSAQLYEKIHEIYEYMFTNRLAVRGSINQPPLISDIEDRFCKDAIRANLNPATHIVRGEVEVRNVEEFLSASGEQAIVGAKLSPSSQLFVTRGIVEAKGNEYIRLKYSHLIMQAQKT